MSAAPALRRDTLDNVQALRGVAALLVLLFHLQGTEAVYVHGTHVLPDACRAGRGGVDLFFIISGLVMVVSTRGRVGRPGEPGRFLLRRALRIYPPYWVYSVLTLSVYLLPAGTVGAPWAEAHLLRSFLLWPEERPPLLNVGWTLVHELYFYLVFAVLLAGSDDGLPRRVLAWAAAVVVGGLAYWAWMDPPVVTLLRVATDPLTVEFVAGCCIAWGARRAWDPRLAWAALVGGAALWLVAAPLTPEGLTSSVPDRWVRVLHMGVPAALLVWGAAALEVEGRLRLPRWLVFIGQASYSLYLGHTLVLAVGRRAWFLVSPAGHVAGGPLVDGLDNVAALGLLAAASVAVAGASYRLLERPLMQAARERLRSRARS